MYFLHTDAKEAAHSLCVQDLQSCLRESVEALKSAHTKKFTKSKLKNWVRASGDNYRWLALFCEEVGRRISVNKAFVSRYHSTIYNLRVCVPLSLPTCGVVDEFPNLLKQRFSNAFDTVSAYRAAYINKRRNNPKWGKGFAPGWFTRSVYTLPSQRKRSQETLRNFASGFGRSEHDGRSVAEW